MKQVFQKEIVSILWIVSIPLAYSIFLGYYYWNYFPHTGIFFLIFIMALISIVPAQFLNIYKIAPYLHYWLSDDE